MMRTLLTLTLCAAGSTAIAQTQLYGPSFPNPNLQGGNIGWDIACTGDITGDGVDDFVVYSSSNFARVHSGSDPSSSWTLPGEPRPEGDGKVEAGDMDGDGIAEVVVSSAAAGVVDVWSGQSIRNGTPTHCRISRASVGQYAGRGLCVSDFNGDGLADLAIGYDQQGPGGRVDVWLSPFVPCGSPSLSINSPNLEHFGITITSSDVTGDGQQELIISALRPGARGVVLVYDLSGRSLGSIQDPTNGASYFGIVLAACGDLTGDGREEFAVGAPSDDSAGPRRGSVRVYRYDGSSILQYASTMFGTFDGASMAPVTSVGDIDGDSIPDLAVSEPASNAIAGVAQGQVHLVSGATLTPYARIGGPPGGDDFGWSLEGRSNLGGSQCPDLLVGATGNGGAVHAFADLPPNLCAATGNRALWIVGHSGYVSVPRHDDFTRCEGITVEAWVYFDPFLAAPGNGSYTIVRNGPMHPFTPFNLRIHNTSSGQPDRLHMAIATANTPGIQNVLAPGAFPLRTWTHVAGTYDGTRIALFIDGIEVASRSASGSLIAGGELRIGKGEDGWPEYWSGGIDAVRIWPFARTASELRGGGSHRYELGAFPGLLASWNMNGNASDSVGIHHGAQVGSASFTSQAPSLSTLPRASAESYGAATPTGCATPIAGLTSLPDATNGNPAFGTVSACGPSGVGFLFVGVRQLFTPVHFLGIDLYVDPVGPLIAFPASSNSRGFSKTVFPIAPSSHHLVGAQVFSQYMWFTGACGAGGVVASRALSLTFL